MCKWATFGVYQQQPEDEWAFPSPSASMTLGIFARKSINIFFSIARKCWMKEILRISGMFFAAPSRSLSSVISSALLIRNNIEKHNRINVYTWETKNLCMKIIRGESSHKRGDTRRQRCISFRFISHPATQYRLSYIKKKHSIANMRKN